MFLGVDILRERMFALSVWLQMEVLGLQIVNSLRPCPCLLLLGYAVGGVRSVGGPLLIRFGRSTLRSESVEQEVVATT